ELTVTPGRLRRRGHLGGRRGPLGGGVDRRALSPARHHRPAPGGPGPRAQAHAGHRGGLARWGHLRGPRGPPGQGYETLAGMICQLANGTVVTPGSLLSYLDAAWLE